MYNIETVDHKNGVVVMNRTGEIVVFDEQERERYRYNVPYGVFAQGHRRRRRLPRGSRCSNGTRTTTSSWPPKPGTVELIDLVEGETTRELYDERTGVSNVVVVEHREKKLHPSIQIFDDKKKRLASITVPAGSYLQVKKRRHGCRRRHSRQNAARNRKEQGHHRRSAARRRAFRGAAAQGRGRGVRNRRHRRIRRNRTRQPQDRHPRRSGSRHTNTLFRSASICASTRATASRRATA